MIKLAILRILDSYFRHRWLNLLPIVIMTIVAVTAFFVTEREYMSQGIFVVQSESLLASITSVDNSAYSWNSAAQDVANEINSLIQSDSFVLAVIDETDLREELTAPGLDLKRYLTDMRGQMWAAVLGPTQISVNASDTNPEIARQLAQAVIDKFVQWKINSSHLESAAAIDFLRQKVADYTVQHQQAQDTLRQYLLDHPQPARGDRPDYEIIEINNLSSNVQFAGSRMTEAMNKEEGAQIAYAQVEADIHQTYFLIDAPVTPTRPALSKRQLALKYGLYIVAGGVLSAILVIGGAVLPLSLWFPMDVQNALNLKVLAEVPDMAWERGPIFPVRKRKQRAALKSTYDSPPTLPFEAVRTDTVEQKAR